MIVLGIESTAHTIGIGIVTSKGEILANEKEMYKSKKGGIIPTEAAMHHRKKAPLLLKKALTKANLMLSDVDKVAVAIGPGLPPTLWEGINFSKTLGKELIGVNHCIAHIEIGKKEGKLKDPLTIYASGGNTQITAKIGDRYRVFGETLDIGIGNAIDKFARSKGLQMPGGPKIEQLALKGKKYIELPYTIKGMDLAFSGVVTSASKKEANLKDLAFSFQETIFSMLTEVSERALAHTEKKEILLTGGVAQNKRLQQMIKKMSEEHKAKFYAPPASLCGDNGAMIAWAGILKRKKEKIEAKPRWRTDEADL